MSEGTPTPELTPSVDASPGPDVTPEVAEVPEWQRQKHKLKIDGEELEVGWDELTKGYQRGASANKRFMEAQKLRQEIDADRQTLKSLFAMAESDPDSLLIQLGINPVEFAESRIMREIESEKMSPQQKEALAWERKAQAARSEVEEFESRKKKEQISSLTEKYYAEFSTTIDNILTKIGAPKTSNTTARAAKLMNLYIENEMEIDVDAISDQLTEELGEENRSYFEKLSPEQIAGILKEDGLKKIREYDLGRLKSDRLPPGRSQQKKAEPKSERMPTSDFFEKIRKSL